MKTLFVWYFMATLNPFHSAFNPDNPVIVGTENFHTLKECVKVVEDMNETIRRSKKATVWINGCVKVTYPTKPETTL